MRKPKTSRLAAEMLQLAGDMKKVGLIDAAVHEKITLRHLGPEPEIAPITSDEVRRMRDKAHMSQAVFARHLNLTAGYISQIERGEKQPTGAALALLNVVKRKGMEAIL